MPRSVRRAADPGNFNIYNSFHHIACLDVLKRRRLYFSHGGAGRRCRSLTPVVVEQSLMATLRTLAGLVIGLAVVVGPLAAQVNEREMFVSVLDEHGSPVPDLRASDFRVREDGALREVVRVARATAPIQLAILVDTSQAAIPAIVHIRNGLHAFVEAMHEGNDLSLVTFGGPPRILVDVTRDRERLNAGVDRVFAYSETAAYLLDAIRETGRGFQRREASRPAIVVVTTDGVDFSGRSQRDALEILGEAGVVMHAVVLRSRGRRGRDRFSGSPTLTDARLSDSTDNRDLLLALGPEATGGRRSNLVTSMGLEDELKAVASELSNQYLVVYVRPARLIPPEEIEVSVTLANLVARGTPVKLAKGE